MAVIGNVFCLDTREIYKRDTLLVVKLEWNKIMDI